MRWLIFTLPLIAGCASNAVPPFWDLTPSEYVSTSPEASDLAKDGAACELEAERIRTNHGYGGLAGVAGMYESRNRAFDACMRMKGYQRRPST
jgi:hypothetical protein